MRDWVTNVQDTFYIIGTVAGPDPYPRMVRDFNAIVGREAREQMLAEYGLPDAITACVGGGSNAIGLFHAFLNDRQVEIVGAEAAGDGISTGRHAASIAAGPGVLHGNRTYVLCDDDGQIIETHSVSAGLDHPGVGPEHAFLADTGRARYLGITDEEALQASICWRIPRASCPRWNPAMRWHRQSSWRVSVRVTRSCCATCPAAATRTCTPSPRAKGLCCESRAAPRRGAGAGDRHGRLHAARSTGACPGAAAAAIAPAREPASNDDEAAHRPIEGAAMSTAGDGGEDQAARAVVSVALDHAGEVLIGQPFSELQGEAQWHSAGLGESTAGRCEYYERGTLPEAWR